MKLSLAGLNVEAKTRYEFSEKLTESYLSNSENTDFSVEVTDLDIKNEAERSDIRYPIGYLESIALYRKIAERLPFYDAVVFHGAVIAYKGCAYAFTARSGVGKTTHIRLWLERFGDAVHILNGDSLAEKFPLNDVRKSNDFRHFRQLLPNRIVNIEEQRLNKSRKRNHPTEFL